MCLPRRWVGLFVASSLLVAGCASDGGGGVPSAELFADPEACDVPCEVLIDSGVETNSDDVLTFTWDLGEGPFEGDARLLYTFETSGTHEITLTVSDGSSSTSDTVTVVAEPQPKTSGEVDEGGGSVSHGDCAVTVPAGIAPGSFSIEIAEIPSMAEAGARRLGDDRFTALGSAYQITTLAKSSVAFDLAVKNAEAVGADAAELGWLVRFIGKPMPTPDSTEPIPSLAPVASYVLEPVTGVDADGTVHGEIFGRARVQLVRLRTPLVIEPEATDANALKASQLPVSVKVEDPPVAMSQAQYAAAIREGVRKGYDVLITQRKFLWVHPSVTVHVVKLKKGLLGEVPRFKQQTINISHALTHADAIKKVVAHEFFHLVQNWHTNWASTGDPNHSNDGWFLEGTASWAMDEVYDDIQAGYFAPAVSRFRAPLVKRHTKAEASDAYETVAFWKWAERQQAEIVRLLLQDRYVKTHVLMNSTMLIQNSVVTDYLTGIKDLWPTADFLQFAYDSLYEKGYDPTETRANELWSNEAPVPRLGPPKEIKPLSQLDLEKDYGDSEANPAETFVLLYRHLVTDMIEVQTKELKGTLHVRFERLSDPLDAKVFVLDKASNEVLDSFSVRDLSKEHQDVKLGFDPDKRAVIMVVDPRWDYPSTTDPMDDANKIEGTLKAWIEDPCGPLPSNVIDIMPSDDLYVALTTAPSGSVVRLAPGTYTPPIKTWTLPGDGGEWPTQVLVNGITLAGSGRAETTLSMRGDEYGSVGFTTYGNATLRDLTIDAGAFWGVTAIGAQSLTLCNVDVQTNGADGVQFSQWPGGGNGFLGIYDSSITYLGSASERHAGMELSCLGESGDLAVDIRDSNISRWYVGVSYTNYSESSCITSLSTDCKGFTDNELANVMYTYCVPPDCTNFVEQCP